LKRQNGSKLKNPIKKLSECFHSESLNSSSIN